MKTKTKKIIVANWKCNPVNLAQAKKLLGLVERGVKDLKNLKVIICPPFLYLPSIKRQASGIRFGAQNCFWTEGAFTGEVSSKMLKGLGVEYVIIGHSERRQNFGETNGIINKKIKSAVAVGLKPILCIGETKEQRRNGQTDDVLLEQLEVGLSGIQLKAGLILIAYEPVWAIGTGNNCQPQDAEKARLLIQEEIGERIPILYGGSVDAKNVKSYLDVEYNGVLVGGASLKSEEFVKLAQNSCK